MCFLLTVLASRNATCTVWRRVLRWRRSWLGIRACSITASCRLWDAWSSKLINSTNRRSSEASVTCMTDRWELAGASHVFFPTFYVWEEGLTTAEQENTLSTVWHWESHGYLHFNCFIQSLFTECLEENQSGKLSLALQNHKSSIRTYSNTKNKHGNKTLVKTYK